MGFLSAFGLTRQSGADALAPGRRVRLASPYTPGMATSILAADWLGAQADLLPVSRVQAMTVPAVVAARNLICVPTSRGFLEAFRYDRRLTTQPRWLTRTDSDVPPQTRLLWTLDDLLFGGFAVWGVDRDSAGRIGDAVRIPPERWDFDPDGSLLVDDRTVNRDQVILFLGRDEGLLTTGATAVRQSLAIARAVTQRAENPAPVTLLKETLEQGRSDGTDPDDLVELEDGTTAPANEVADLMDAFASARRRRDGANLYVPYGIDVVPFGEGQPQFYEQARNAATLDIARLTGIPGSQLEASQVAASLTYETQEGARGLLLDRQSDWAGLIDARLSMDDVTPPGTRIALNLTHLAGADTGTAPATED